MEQDKFGYAAIIMGKIFLLKDVAQISGQSIHTVKYYLKIDLIKEVDRSPGTDSRYFNNSTLRQLTKIRKLRKQNKPIREIQATLNR